MKFYNITDDVRSCVAILNFPSLDNDKKQNMLQLKYGCVINSFTLHTVTFEIMFINVPEGYVKLYQLYTSGSSKTSPCQLHPQCGD